MKRAHQLQPLSRQHHLGLNLSRHARDCTDSPDEISKHWQALSGYMHDMHNHFQIEDYILASALQPYKDSHSEVALALNTLDEQHTLLREMTAEIDAQMNNSQDRTSNIPEAEKVRQLAHLLYDHIRFEERELFPIAERYLSEEELDAIYDASPDEIKHLDEGR